MDVLQVYVTRSPLHVLNACNSLFSQIALQKSTIPEAKALRRVHRTSLDTLNTHKIRLFIVSTVAPSTEAFIAGVHIRAAEVFQIQQYAPIST
jgi:hypothetical protein